MKKTFALIGNPVSHSLSPIMHNAAFRALGIDAQYITVQLEPHELKNFFKDLRSKKISGINITVPFKQKVFDFIDKPTATAQKTGAINTVFWLDDCLVGANTDGKGYFLSLINETGFDPKDKNITIIGAGGACRAIAFSLSKHNLKSLTIINRTLKNALLLTKDLKKHFPDIKTDTASIGQENSKLLSETDLLINTSSLGMKNNPWPNVNFVKDINPNAIVSDIVYNPKKTELLAKALDKKLRVHYGIGMLLHQGALAFELFTGKKAPLKTMRDAV